jgi:hypothetical protein
MSEEIKIEAAEVTKKTRRDFVRTSAQVAVTAPAVALLLNATAKPAQAQISVYQATVSHILDDFTFGNTDEDIDARAFGNFNPLNGTANQDDQV